MVRDSSFNNNNTVYLSQSARTEQLVDLRDTLSDKDSGLRLYPYAKDLHYHPSGILSMTVEIYDDENSHEFTFGFSPNGPLRQFLNRILEEDNGS